VNRIFNKHEAALFVDETNTFNSLNRASTLINVQTICPAVAPFLINTYRSPGTLFVDGSSILSVEGTTQGDPFSMVMYAIGVTPLINHLEPIDVQQVWYADDTASGGYLENLKKWWDELCKLGPKLGYFPNEKKTKLLVKREHHAKALSFFRNTNIEITTDGTNYLGGAIGSTEYITSVIKENVQEWCDQIKCLAKIVLSEPHAAFAAFTHGIAATWQYLSRVTNIPSVTTGVQPLDLLEECIHRLLLPALTGKSHVSIPLRNLLSLPFRYGGMNLTNPSTYLPDQYSLSLQICHPLINQYFTDSSDFDIISATLDQQEVKRNLITDRNNHLAAYTESLKSEMDPSTQLSLSLSLGKGASLWLSTLPISSHGFHLSKSAFRDAVHLRYGWEIPNTPLSCQCGHTFTLDHIMSCPTGGFPIIRHNEIRDITASLLSEVCSNVTIEPHLQLLTGEHLTWKSSNSEPDARLDISANGVWEDGLRRRFSM
jgi:hypothetical protein